MRAFIAFPLPDNVCRTLEKETEILRSANPRIRWIKPQSLHITVAFLGDISPEQRDIAIDRIEAVRAVCDPIAAEICGVGSFPPRGKPRVIFAAIAGGYSEMAALRLTTLDYLAAFGDFGNGAYTPHITLARLRRGGQIYNPVDRAISEPIHFTIDRLVLFESILASGGAQYVVLHSATLSKTGKDYG